jgi:hypothetical protein
MFDPPHLLKSIRNNLSKYAFHYENVKTSWNVIKQYYSIDIKQKFRLTPKLTDNHILLGAFKKMKVKYATQVCSRSLAAALATHAKILGSDAIGTAQFLINFNDIFDAVNSSQKMLKNTLKGALDDSSPHIEFLKEKLKWLKNIKIINGNVPARNIKCLLGWQISITAILELWPVLRDNYKFDYLLTRRLNSDPLENFFSVIRQKGGNCTNPTPFNFAQIYKQVSCQKLLNPVKNGNCEMDLNTILATLSTTKETKKKKQLLTALFRWLQKLMLFL